MIKNILFLLFVVFQFHASARRMAPVRKDLLDGKYTISKLYDGKSLRTVSGIKSTITMSSKENRINAYFGCNRMSGDFQISNYMLIPIQLMGTEMLCSDKIQSVESRFGRYIAECNRFTIVKNTITFYKEEVPYIVFKKVAITKKKK